MGRSLLIAIAAVLAFAAPAAAVDRYVPMAGAPAPGPAKYDKVWVQQIGPKDADRVLVVVPGTLGGAGGISDVARDIVARVPKLQVWIVDRREQAFEDTSVFERSDPAAAQDYYLGFKYERVTAADAPFVSEWGLKTQLNDLRRVVLAARKGGREVLLGGHSAGASTAVAYAAWDFAGRPGYRDLSGLVLIDGGLLGTFNSADAQRARADLADLRAGKDVFLDLLGLGLPEIAGILTQVGALWADQQPDELSVLQQFPLLPAYLRPPFPVTNLAAYAYAFDETYAPDSLALIQLRAGQLAATGDPRGWRDGQLTPIRRFAKAWAANDPNATEWYYPRRLLLDIDAASPVRQNAAARVLGLRLLHADDIDVPLYAYGTALAKGRVTRGARRLSLRAHTGKPVLVDDRNANHLDPISAAPERNRFLKTVVPFLRKR